MIDCLYFFMECLCSLLLPDICLHLILLSPNIISRPKQYISFQDWHVILKLKLMIVLVYSSWISWWNVCPSLWIVCLHYFFQIYIFIWSFYPSTSVLGQKHTYKIMIDMFFLDKAKGRFSIKFFNFNEDCMSLFLECLSSLLFP